MSLIDQWNVCDTNARNTRIDPPDTTLLLATITPEVLWHNTHTKSSACENSRKTFLCENTYTCSFFCDKTHTNSSLCDNTYTGRHVSKMLHVLSVQYLHHKVLCVRTPTQTGHCATILALVFPCLRTLSQKAPYSTTPHKEISCVTTPTQKDLCVKTRTQKALQAEKLTQGVSLCHKTRTISSLCHNTHAKGDVLKTTHVLSVQWSHEKVYL